MIKKLFLIFVIFALVKTVFSCDLDDKHSSQDEIAIWLGNNSVFSKAYRDGKCVLDKALIDIPNEQRKIIASLIAKSYGLEEDKLQEVFTYNY